MKKGKRPDWYVGLNEELIPIPDEDPELLTAHVSVFYPIGGESPAEIRRMERNINQAVQLERKLSGLPLLKKRKKTGPSLEEILAKDCPPGYLFERCMNHYRDDEPILGPNGELPEGDDEIPF